MTDVSQPASKAGAVQVTTMAAMGGSTAVVVAMWAVHPGWPPPMDVVVVVLGWIAPALHLIGRGIYRRIEKWSGEQA